MLSIIILEPFIRGLAGRGGRKTALLYDLKVEMSDMAGKTAKVWSFYAVTFYKLTELIAIKIISDSFWWPPFESSALFTASHAQLLFFGPIIFWNLRNITIQTQPLTVRLEFAFDSHLW